METIGTIIYEDGKLGKAAKIGTGTQVTNGIRFNSNLVEELGDEYSCSVWIKPMGNHVHYEGTIISSGDWNHSRWAFGVNQNNSKVDAFGRNHNCHITCTVPVGEWTHLVSTMKNNVATLYKNGVYVGTYTFPDGSLTSDSAYTCIGRETYAGGYFGFNGYIQDVRIYNHCLSDREIKKLAKGLVLHIPLSRNGFGQDNLIPNGSNFSLWSKEGTSSVTLEEDGWYHIQSTNTNTSRYGCYYNLTFPEVGTYTLSAMVKTDWHIGFQALNAFNWTGQTVYGTGAERIASYTVTTTEENNKCCIYIYGQNTINSTYIKWIKVEKGDKATTWTPNSSDALYTKMGLNDNIERDVSGYQHNAVLNNITYSPDTPFSKMCSVLNGTNSYIKINDNTWMVDKSDEMTLNMWAYFENWESQTALHLFSCTESGGFNTEKGDTGCIRFQVHIYSNEQQTSTAYQAHSSAIRLADLTSGWHMFTAIYTTSGRWIYIDGVLHSSISLTSYGLHFYKNARLFLGCEANTANPSSPYFNGKMSDFRLYYTALSENDIKDLYEKR